jgi:CheY-like chemotaxis protein
MGDSAELTNKSDFQAMLRRPFRPTYLGAFLAQVMTDPKTATGRLQNIDDLAAPDSPPLIKVKESSLSVLLVTENALNRKIGSNLLSNLGYTSDIVSNLSEALEAIDGRQFDFILVDTEMSDTDVSTTTHQILAALPAGQHSTIIGLVSSNVDKAKFGEDSGLDGYLQKPLNAKALLEVIGRLKSTD